MEERESRATGDKVNSENSSLQNGPMVFYSHTQPWKERERELLEELSVSFVPPNKNQYLRPFLSSLLVSMLRGWREN